MNEPRIARILLAAASAPSEYECIFGDLAEEHAWRSRAHGAGAADAWYWSQVLRSLAPLFGLSRARRSPLTMLGAVAGTILVLFGMLVTNDAIAQLSFVLVRNVALARPLYVCADFCLAAFCGALLAIVLRAYGTRSVAATGVLFAAAFAAPILVGVSPPLPTLAWFLILGAVPMMTVGAAAYNCYRNY
jgi:hypothetical protein